MFLGEGKTFQTPPTNIFTKLSQVSLKNYISKTKVNKKAFHKDVNRPLALTLQQLLDVSTRGVLK